MVHLQFAKRDMRRGCCLQRIMGVNYKFPSNLHLSRECLDLISQVFVANPAQRVTLKGLKQHPWFLQNLPDELKVCVQRHSLLLGRNML